MTKRMFTVPSGDEVEIDEHNYITTEVVMDVADIIANDLERFLDLISLMATDTEILGDISYTPTQLTAQGNLAFSVRGDVSLILEMEDSNNG